MVARYKHWRFQITHKFQWLYCIVLYVMFYVILLLVFCVACKLRKSFDKKKTTSAFKNILKYKYQVLNLLFLFAFSFENCHYIFKKVSLIQTIFTIFVIYLWIDIFKNLMYFSAITDTVSNRKFPAKIVSDALS